MRIIVRKAEAYSRKSVAVFMAMCLLLSCMVIGLTTVSIGDVNAAVGYSGKTKYVNADFFDYYYDDQILNNQQTPQKGATYKNPYTIFNSLISASKEDGEKFTTSMFEWTANVRNWQNQPTSSEIHIWVDGGSDITVWDSTDPKMNILYNSNTGVMTATYTVDVELAKKIDSNIKSGRTVRWMLHYKDAGGEYQTSSNYILNNGWGRKIKINASSSTSPAISYEGSNLTVSTAGCLYDIPLYFGQFWINEENTSTYNSMSASTQGLNNFYWGANLAFRPATNSNTAKQYNTVAQGIVDSKSGENVLQNGKSLPYFDKEWISNTRYTNGNPVADYTNVSFPFYEFIDDYGVKHYKFDSNEKAVYIDKNNGKDENLIEYSSSNVHGTNTGGGDEGIGFFPFNTVADSQSQKINYGFGARFDIDFSITKTGKYNGQDLSFEFKGDDDVWIFIDDVLVLDMGGGHKEAHGTINFATGDAVIEYAGNATTQTIKSDSMTSLGIVTNKKINIYDGSDGISLNLKDGKEHRITMYYMERGMLNSNLYVDFSAVLDSTLTIEDVLDTSDVNEKFLSELQKAAEKDIFNYELKNDSEYEGSDALMYPSNVDVSRENGITTWLSKQNTSNKTKNNFIPNTENKVKNVNFAWADTSGQTTGQVDDLVGQTDGDGILRLMHSQSATFTDQFVIDSNMTVNLTSLTTQGETPEGGITPLNSNSGRNPSDYYITTSVVKDADNKDVTVNADGSYNFNNNSGKGNVILTQTFTHKVKTGSLTIEKKVSNDDNTNNEFEFEVVFSDIFGDTTSGTVTESFTLKNGDTKTIEGIPVGTKYTITESPDTGYIVKEIKSFDGTSVTNTVNTETSTGTIPVGNDGVEVKVTYTNELVRNITIAKEVYESDGTNRDSDDTTNFTFEITLTKGGAPYTETIATDTGTTVSNGSRVTINQKQAITLKNVPIDVTVAISEDSAAGYELFAVNDSSSTSVTDNSTSNKTYTFKNKKVSAPAGKATIQIKKYIDELYYGESDNPHGFSDDYSLVGTKNAVDPHGYEKYTKAEQSFIFKIEKIDSTSKKVLGTAYVVLKFDSNSRRLETADTSGYVFGEFWYCQETDAFEVDAGYDYKVSEMLDGDNNIAWRYQCPGLNCSCKDGSGGDKINFDSSGSDTNKYVKFYEVKGGDSMEVTFYNLKNTDKSSIEGDMSSKENEISAA